MLNLDYEYACPHCGERFMGEFDINGSQHISEEIKCEECGEVFELVAGCHITFDVETIK